MTRPASTKLTPEVARELCQRAGSKAYIAGSIGIMGSEYVLGLKAVNCQTGDTLARSRQRRRPKRKCSSALGAAASKLRSELGESLATVQKFNVPLQQATTPSLEALKAYSLGRNAERRERCRRGTCLTTNVPSSLIRILPWATRHLAATTLLLAELGRASEYFTKAFQLREHASELEKLAITAVLLRWRHRRTGQSGTDVSGR